VSAAKVLELFFCEFLLEYFLSNKIVNIGSIENSQRAKLNQIFVQIFQIPNNYLYLSTCFGPFSKTKYYQIPFGSNNWFVYERKTKY
jgi:hypothetical protein